VNQHLHQEGNATPFPILRLCRAVFMFIRAYPWVHPWLGHLTLTFATTHENL